jgi:putative hydrolase of the HAD superfamily
METSRTSPSVVCFDIGGVLAQICHTWQDAAQVAGVTHGLPLSPSSRLIDLAEIHTYQSGELSYHEYLAALGTHLSCSAEDAERVHRGILVVEYPGVDQLEADVRAAGWTTGCLSNTNEPHWIELIDPARFPTIAGLDFKMASHEVGLGKPDPAIYRAYCERFGVEPSNIVFFDDYEANVTAARQEGWRAHTIDASGDTAAQMRTILEAEGVLSKIP